MLRRLIVGSIVATAALAAVGCKRAPSKSVVKSDVAAVVAAPTATAVHGNGLGGGAGGDDNRRGARRLQEAGAYLDGKHIGVFRATELPTGLKPRDPVSYEYPVAQYARALGVDVAKLRAVHFYGGGRVAVVTGDAFRKAGNGLTFNFSLNDRGKPKMNFPKIKVNTTVDMLTRMAFYVEKAPPTLREGNLYLPDGTLVEGVPYGESDPGFGTRTYADNRLVGVMKRRKQAFREENLAAFAQSSGVEHARGVEIISGDAVIARLDKEQMAKVSFGLPGRTHGIALIDLRPVNGPKDARATSFRYYSGAPSTRPLEPEEAAIEEQSMQDTD